MILEASRSGSGSPDGTSRIVFGNSFSGGDPTPQVRSFVKYYRVIREATKVEKNADGAPNPLFGAVLDPFYLFAGQFSEQAQSGNGIAVAKLLRTAVADGRITRDDVRGVGALTLLGVGACTQCPRDLSIFFRHNLFVGGTDTLHAYKLLEELKADDDDDMAPGAYQK